MASAAVFAVTFSFVVVVFRFIRAYQFKKAKLKDSHTVLFAKYRIFWTAQGKIRFHAKYATILREFSAPSTIAILEGRDGSLGVLQ